IRPAADFEQRTRQAPSGPRHQNRCGDGRLARPDRAKPGSSPRHYNFRGPKVMHTSKKNVLSAFPWASVSLGWLPLLLVASFAHAQARITFRDITAQAG